MRSSQNRARVFISYSHKDARFLRQLRAHVAPEERDGIIKVWADDRLEGGDVWHKTIRQAIAAARVAICLVSADFFTSEFIESVS
jgi:hypothetical protein